MRQRRPTRWVAAVAALMCACATWAAPTIAQADAAARSALALNQYSRAVVSYEGLDQSLLTEQSFYRLAIAHQRLGDSVEAKKALERALAKNPSGSFASSPARLALLKTDIQSGIDKRAVVIGVPVTLVGATMEIPASAASSADVPANAAALVASEPASDVAPAASSPALPASTADSAEAPAASLQAQVAPAVATPSITSNSVRDAGVLGLPAYAIGLLCMMLGGGAISFNSVRANRRIKQMQDDAAPARAAANADREGLLSKAREEVKNAVEAVQAKADLALERTAQALLESQVTAEGLQLKVAILDTELAAFKNKPVSDVGDLVALRNELTKMRELILAAGSADSLLLNAITALEPVVEMEIGRNHFRLHRNPGALVAADREKLASVMQLERMPMNLDAAEPEAVMSYISTEADRFLNTLGLARAKGHGAQIARAA